MKIDWLELIIDLTFRIMVGSICVMMGIYLGWIGVGLIVLFVIFATWRNWMEFKLEEKYPEYKKYR